jgi:Bacterial antitoxin of type II TA system, VapB
MRTTVDIADDLLAQAKVLAASSHRTLSAVVSDALRVLLKRDETSRTAGNWTFPTDGDGGLRPGVNPEDKEALADLLGENALP